MIAVKELVLYHLKISKTYLSTEEMCRAIGVSHAAIDDAIEALRLEGYSIDSVSNRGYRLISGSERLSSGELLPLIGEARASKVTVLSTIDSTNTYLKNLCAEGIALPGTCIIADCQTGGRGRLGRSFESPAGKGLYLSFALDPKDTSPAGIAEITAWGAVAVREAIAQVTGLEPGIKWVNDLVIGTRKVCGILTELSTEGESGKIQSVIMGIGLNVLQTAEDFSPAVRKIATSLSFAAGKPVSRVRLAAAIIQRLDRLSTDFPIVRERYQAAYRAHCVTLHRSVRVARGNVEESGTAVGIDNHFNLLVRFQDGVTRPISGGEVSIRGFYGVE